jgi:hypothetical protein
VHAIDRGMEFGPGGRSRRRRQRDVVPGESEYCSKLRFYRIPPMQAISLEDFEELALSRLKCERVDVALEQC